MLIHYLGYFFKWFNGDVVMFMIAPLKKFIHYVSKLDDLNL